MCVQRVEVEFELELCRWVRLVGQRWGEGGKRSGAGVVLEVAEVGQRKVG